MSKIQTVTLELLRPGPAHNQLLSPLTDYIGLCGNEGAVTVNVPYEHKKFISRHKELRYWGGKADDSLEDTERRQEILKETAVEISGLLGSVPGLVRGLSMAQAEKNSFTHLKLVLSAAELALLPFELSKVPRGCTGGEDGWLSLQTVAPVCITRQTRTVSDRAIKWSRKPRILFIASSSAGKVPMQQHLRAIHKSILPWLYHFDEKDPESLANEVGKILTILPDATIEEIQEACSKTAYTHVHILAHGMQNEKLPGSPYGLALHERFDKRKVDIVSGSRFATALAPQASSQSATSVSPCCHVEMPSVVTVASCDSGNIKEVIYTGASFAHDLHQSGIPFVVASQFPLSFSGSVLMAEVVYNQLLWGKDPRCMLSDLRQRLYALHMEDTHDWASIVAYEALPFDLVDQLRDARYMQSKAAVDATMNRIDKVIDEIDSSNRNDGVAFEDKIEKLIKEVDNAAEVMPLTGEYETEGTGMLASTEKRKAEAWYKASQNSKNLKENQRFLENCIKALTKSLKKYENAYRENMIESGSKIVKKKRSLHWVLVQYLSLRIVLSKEFSIDHWYAARVSAEVDITAENPETRAFAHGSLTELFLLLLAYNEEMLPRDITHDNARQEALDHARQVVSESDDPFSFTVYSTRRQFKRYIDWWGKEDFIKAIENVEYFKKFDMLGTANMVKLAEEIVILLPEQ